MKTVPVPLKPAPLSRKVWTPDDIVTPADTSEAHVAACHQLLQQYGGAFFNAGPFTPFFLHEDGGRVKAADREVFGRADRLDAVISVGRNRVFAERVVLDAGHEIGVGSHLLRTLPKAKGISRSVLIK